LREELVAGYGVGGMTSRSPLMQRIFDVLPAIASSPSTVLVLGQTGTGKEVVARTIPTLSQRRAGPFVAVNCAALPDTLLESELFGYKAGAFTGAVKSKPGRFALARGGTIFLDEIGEITPALQVRLLRVLQEHAYEPLGATCAERTDARVIVATNRDLAALVRRGAFREDLYYRINVVRIELPALHRRAEDIPLLVTQFIERFNRLQGRHVSGIAPEALALLMGDDWPGNGRELENCIERAFILCTGDQIAVRDLPPELLARTTAVAAPGARAAHAEFDAQIIRAALKRHGGNRLAAARALGIHKTTLHRKIKRLGIPLPARDGRSRREG